MSDKLLILERGAANAFGSGLYSSGNFTVTYNDANIESYFKELENNGYVVDKFLVASDPDFHKWVVSCPLLNHSLPPRSVERFGKRLVRPKISEMSIFDNVGIQLYVEYWRSKGARIGKRTDNEIKWEDGFVSRINENE